MKFKAEPLKPAVFPTSQKSKANHFTIVDASEDEALIAVMHTYTEERGDAKVQYKIGRRTKTADGTRGMFSETIAARSPEEAQDLAVAYPKNNHNACPAGGALVVSDMPAGTKFAVIARRGDCTFVEKLNMAFEAGAKALIVVNKDENAHLYMAGPEGKIAADIPAVIIAKSDGEDLIKAALTAPVPPTMRIYEEDQTTRALYRHANLYASGAHGQQFTVTLKSVRYSPYSGKEFVDVHKVASVEGTYVANYVDQTDNKIKSAISYNKGTAPLSLDLIHAPYVSYGLNVLT